MRLRFVRKLRSGRVRNAPQGGLRSALDSGERCPLAGPGLSTDKTNADGFAVDLLRALARPRALLCAVTLLVVLAKSAGEEEVPIEHVVRLLALLP